MGIVNSLLSRVGLRLSRVPPPPPGATLVAYRARLASLRQDPDGYVILEQPLFHAGAHPADFTNSECAFASGELDRIRPSRILDVGSYRHFILGLSAAFRVVSVDVRARASMAPNETVLVGDAKRLPVASGSIDCVVSLCTIEHLGLGRYGDAFDPSADAAAASEMARVLRPGGALILSTTYTQGPAAIAFNAHRIYSQERLRGLLSGMEVVRESLFHRDGRPCRREDAAAGRGEWSVYCVSLVKPSR